MYDTFLDEYTTLGKLTLNNREILHEENLQQKVLVTICTTSEY